jgi:heptosyltransferase III
MSFENKKRVLVYRLGSLGDTIIVLPAFHLIRKTFPNSYITLLTNEPIGAKAPAIASILENTGLIDKTLAYPVKTRNLSTITALHRQIKKGGFDVLVYLAKPKGGIGSLIRDYIFFRASGISKIVGLPWAKADRQCLYQPGADAYEWDCERTMRCLGKLGKADLQNSFFWNLKLTRFEEHQAENLLEPIKGTRFFALSVGGKASSKDWEDPNWRSLLTRLASAFSNHCFVFVGAEDESARSRGILNLIGGRGLDLCGKTTPRVAAAVLKRAELFIGHDSGPMHLAACVGTRVAAVFSAQNRPGEWYPRGGTQFNVIHYHKTECFGCGLTDCIKERKRCILSITVDQVYQSIIALKIEEKYADA